MIHDKVKIAVLGLGYVGLPLAVAFGRHFQVLGFDVNTQRVNELKNFNDNTLELSSQEITESGLLSFSSNKEDLQDINFYIVTVPTPIKDSNEPDLEPLKQASSKIGAFLKQDDIVVYESTVYPGVTEEVCVPILEQTSGLKFNKDFFAGYSPERINPGDKKHRLKDIVKVTSGSTPEVANFIDNLYKKIIDAGTFKASSIKVAEAAKVIENTQRDVNIALINELSKIFSILEIDTEEVLNAAGTKWNFLPFRPGLVGGHCIGVDPYYLTYQAQKSGYNPEIILAGRRLNDGMGEYVASNLVRKMNQNFLQDKKKVLVMGLTFKENCPDIRNSKVFDIVDFLENHDVEVDVFDPWVDQNDLSKSIKLVTLEHMHQNSYHGIVIAVAHKQFIEMGINFIRSLGIKKSVLYDLKHIFKPSDAELRL